MSFVSLAIGANPSQLSSKVENCANLDMIHHPDFLEDLLRCTRELEIDDILDPGLVQ